MKQTLSFILGIIAGVLLTLIVSSIGDDSQSEATEEVAVEATAEANTTVGDKSKPLVSRKIANATFYKEVGEVYDVAQFKVIKVNADGTALAKNCTFHSEGHWFTGELYVLLINDKGMDYYDNQIVEAKKGEKFKQVGIYKGSSSTLPIVMLMP